MELDGLMKMLGENGVVAGLLVFFVWWSSKSAAAREKHMNDRISALDTRLLNLLEITTEQIAKSTVAIESNTQIVESLRRLIEERLIVCGKAP